MVDYEAGDAPHLVDCASASLLTKVTTEHQVELPDRRQTLVHKKHVVFLLHSGMISPDELIRCDVAGDISSNALELSWRNGFEHKVGRVSFPC